jgi:hypothetical protein
MAVGKMKRRTEGRVITQSNLQKLLLKGRVKIDPATNMPVMPKRNVLMMGVSPHQRPMEINGGHAKADDSVWRVALGGPSRFVWKFMKDEVDYRVKGGGTRVISAPVLTQEEVIEAREFVTYVLEKRKEDKSVLPDDFLNDKYDYGKRELFAEMDKGFYKWKEKYGKKVELSKLSDLFAFLPF